LVQQSDKIDLVRKLIGRIAPICPHVIVYRDIPVRQGQTRKSTAPKWPGKIFNWPARKEKFLLEEEEDTQKEEEEHHHHCNGLRSY
jgi:hypothetical protein